MSKEYSAGLEQFVKNQSSLDFENWWKTYEKELPIHSRITLLEIKVRCLTAWNAAVKTQNKE